MNATKAPSMVVLDAMDACDQLAEDFIRARANNIVGTALQPYKDGLDTAAQHLISLTTP